MKTNGNLNVNICGEKVKFSPFRSLYSYYPLNVHIMLKGLIFFRFNPPNISFGFCLTVKIVIFAGHVFLWR